MLLLSYSYLNDFIQNVTYRFLTNAYHRYRYSSNRDSVVQTMSRYLLIDFFMLIAVTESLRNNKIL